MTSHQKVVPYLSSILIKFNTITSRLFHNIIWHVNLFKQISKKNNQLCSLCENDQKHFTNKIIYLVFFRFLILNLYFEMLLEDTKSLIYFYFWIYRNSMFFLISFFFVLTFNFFAYSYFLRWSTIWNIQSFVKNMIWIILIRIIIDEYLTNIETLYCISQISIYSKSISSSWLYLIDVHVIKRIWSFQWS